MLLSLRWPRTSSLRSGVNLSSSAVVPSERPSVCPSIRPAVGRLDGRGTPNYKVAGHVDSMFGAVA